MDVSPENLFQHTAARRRLREFGLVYAQGFQFQHTAARRRLLKGEKSPVAKVGVSTHSRPKAAALFKIHIIQLFMFQHTAARRRLQKLIYKH